MLVTEAQLFGERVAQRRRRQHRDAIDPEAIFRDLNELRPAHRWCTASTASAATWA
jgi:hypothetical protein